MEILTGCGRCACFLVFLLAISSCSGLSFREAGPKGVYHRVKSGETLSAIARAYQTDIQSIARINNITDPSVIEKDSVIFIPHAQRVVENTQIISISDKTSVKTHASDHAIDKRGVPIAGNGDASQRASAGKKTEKPVSGDGIKEEDIGSSEDSGDVLISKSQSEKTETINKEKKSQQPTAGSEKLGQTHFDKNLFIWPVAGKVASFFGVQPDGMFFNGIKISSASETAVLAARDGFVIRSERLKYYGETIIIQHEDDYATVYANLAVRAVDLKSRVKKGERIGFIGKVSGNKELYLYFEIRHKNKAKNPLFFLP